MIINQKFKSLIPPLSEEEYNQLEFNILQDGIREPISTWNKTIIDGHNRYEIALKYNLDFETTEYVFTTDNDVELWILKNQLGRRNLSAYDRSVLALKLKPVIAIKAKEKEHERKTTFQKSEKSNVKKINTAHEVAKFANVSHDTIAKVEIIENEATPEIKQKIKSGNISINQAYKEVKKQQKHKERKNLEEQGKSLKINYDLRFGDFTEVLADIPDNSVDCIITDPPYPYNFIECWSDLSKFAKRVLKPHGFCIAYSGQSYLLEVMNRLGEHLDYYWCMSMYMPGATQIVNTSNAMCRWKPILIYQKDRKRFSGVFDDYFINEKSNKDGHDWQQGESGVAFLIEKFTNAGDLIIDPFCGAGTTLKVATTLKRNCISAEIDEQTYNIAKARLYK